MMLDTDDNRVVWLRLEALKEPKTMSHVTFAEIYGHEKGVKEGMKRSLREALVVKFPAEGPALFDELKEEQNADRLEALLRAAVLASSVEDFRARIASAPSGS